MKKKRKNRKLYKKALKTRRKIKKIKKKIKKTAQKRIRRNKRKKHLKKLTRIKKRAEVLNHMAEELIEKGRKRGFITYDEILKTFPDIENNIFFLDELYEKFGVAGIDVLEGGNLLNLDIDITDKDLNKSTIHDSIQMYLKEIGQYPLIHANEEKDLA